MKVNRFEWNSTNDRQPEEGRIIICYAITGDIWIGWRNHERYKSEDMNYCYVRPDYWSYIPCAPKEVEDILKGEKIIDSRQ